MKYLTRLPSTENTELSRVPSFQPGVDYDMASNASPAVGNTAFVFLPSRFMSGQVVSSMHLVFTTINLTKK